MPLQRSGGILLHPTSLPSPGGIGDLGREAYAFVDFLARARQSLWQILPLSPPGMNHSPYSAISAFAGNPLLISLERLAAHGWLDRDRIAPAAVPPGALVDFEDVKGLKMPILRQAAQSFLGAVDAAGRRRFEDFKRDSGWWLDDFVLFEVIRREHKGAAWSTWPRSLARRDSESLRQFAGEYQGELEVERAIQFAFFEQWRALHHYCDARAIKIVGDVAIFVDYDSADVWSNSDLFSLDENLQPTLVSGVPPDAFSATGQRWGNPLYRWDRCREQGFRWWIQRMAWALKSCDIVRLDHFRGFESYWEIPAWEPTAIHGQWKEGPQDELFRVLRENLGDLPFIAEDLGFITPEVHAMRDRLGIPGMKVLQFAFGDPGARIYLPQNYPPNCVVYSGTHDNDTTLGWWRSGASKEERTNVEAYMGPMNDGISWAFIRLAFASVARLAVVPIQDVLGLSSDARMNTPARIQGNWGWRLAPHALTNELADKLAALTIMCDRAPEPPPAHLQPGEASADFSA